MHSEFDRYQGRLSLLRNIKETRRIIVLLCKHTCIIGSVQLLTGCYSYPFGGAYMSPWGFVYVFPKYDGKWQHTDCIELCFQQGCGGGGVKKEPLPPPTC